MRLVELELWSYCNRKCFWCPNNFIDRQNNKFMNKNIFMKIIQSLKEMNYDKYITFSRYNEPFAFPVLFHMTCEYIKKELPNCTLVTNTNGDYLTPEIIQSCLIDELTIMDYDNKGLENCLARLISWGCDIDRIANKYIYAHYQSMKILYYINWTDNYTPGNRGGILPINSPIRRFSCLEPQYFIGINYDGTISPCCNIRNDIGKHKKYIVGDLNKDSLKQILNNRKKMINYCLAADFEPCSPCYTCTNIGGRYTREKGGIDYE